MFGCKPFTRKAKTIDEQDDEGGQGKHVAGKENISSNGTLPNVDNGRNCRGGASDGSDGDYDDKNDFDNAHNDEDSELGNSDKESDDHSDQMHSKHTHEQKDCQPIEILGLRRSSRTVASNGHQKHAAPNVDTKTHADTKDVLRERANRNTNYDIIVSDSEDGNSEDDIIVSDSLNDLNENVLDTEKESTVAANGSNLM